MIKYLILSIVFLFIGNYSAIGQEVIATLDKIGLSTLNEELRKSAEGTRNNKSLVTSLQTTVNNLETEFSITDGHTHDGNDSKKVPVANIDVSSVEVDQYLYNDSGVIKGKNIEIKKGMKLVSTTTFSNSADSGNITIDYSKEYVAIFEINDMGAGVTLNIEFTPSSGGTYYFKYTKDYAAAFVTGSTSGLLYEESTYGGFATGRIHLRKCPKSTNKILWDGELLTTENTNDYPVIYNYYGSHIATSNQTAFKLSFSAATADGTIWLYEIEK